MIGLSHKQLGFTIHTQDVLQLQEEECKFNAARRLHYQFHRQSMPSRKKAQGRARKAKQAAAARSNPFYQCHHFGQLMDWSQDDHDAVDNLWDEYEAKYFDALKEDDNNIIALRQENATNVTYDKYNQLSDVRKDLFRRIVLAAGTETCKVAAKEKDLTKESTIQCVESLSSRDQPARPVHERFAPVNIGTRD
eukprot:scaffold248363_cov77-Cyclotella_meneghiniana.AAC.1